MISITNNAKSFFEMNDNTPIILYGAGNSGYWTGYYMVLCGIPFSHYIDSTAVHENLFMNGRPIYDREYFSKHKNEKFRIVVLSKSYESVIFDLVSIMDRYKVDLICLVPKYRRRLATLADECYDINKFLGYFRRKLIKGKIPSLISNDCTAGHIYEMLDSFLLSPTINLGIEPDDFIKMCEEPQRYLAKDIDEVFWTKDVRFGYGEYPVGRLGDIYISFLHYKTEDECKESWSLLKKNIDYDNLIFIMSDAKTISLDTQRRFDQLKTKHLTIHRKNKTLYLSTPTENHLYMEDYFFSIRDSAIENYWDLLGWLNSCGAESE